MKVKLIDLLNFREIYSQLEQQDMPIRLAYRFNKINDLLLAEEKFYQQKFSDILQRYCEVDENGEYLHDETNEGIKIKPEFVELCHQKINELNNLEIEINDAFTLDELSTLYLSPKNSKFLVPFIQE